METVPPFAHGDRLTRPDLELITDDRRRYDDSRRGDYGERRDDDRR